MRSFINNRRVIVFALLLVVVSLSTDIMRSKAQEQRLPKPSGHVNDFGACIDAATRQRLEVALENLKQKTDLDFVIVTLKSAGSEDLYDCSLQIANDWNVGAPASPSKSLLLVIAADNGKFFMQASRGARTYLPDGLIGDLGQRLRAKIDSVGYSQALLSGMQAFLNTLGERENFNFEALDTQASENQIAKTRP